jgi:ABC-2 type transport system permease protein
MLERIHAMLRKEFAQVFRDPRMRMVIVGVPIIQCLIFGYAVTLDVRHIDLAVIDRDNTPASREFVAAFLGSDCFDARLWTDDAAGARLLLDAGEAGGVLRIDAGFGRALDAGIAAPVQLVVDGADSNTARLVLNYSEAIATRFNRTVQFRRLEQHPGAAPLPAGIDLRPRAWFNENLESRNYMVPGIMALLVMLVTLMLTGMAIVREKEVGTIEQIMVTPIRPVEFILGKCAPFVVIGFVDVLLVMVVGVGWFGVPIRGSIPLLLAGMGLFLMSTLGMGLLISTLSATQQQAMMTTFLFFFPAMLFSGFIYPVANMPEPVRWINLANPLCHALVIIRGIFLKGVGADILWPELLALFLIGSAVLTCAVTRFRKTMG